MRFSDEPNEVTVYNYLTFDRGWEARTQDPFKAPREKIETVLQGKVLEGTGESVPASQLDEEGRYRRKATGWGDLT